MRTTAILLRQGRSAVCAIGRAWPLLIALLLLSLWTTWWIRSLHRNRLLAAQHTQVPAHRFLGLDFLNNYHASRLWLAGRDPFHESFPDPLGRKYCYPPLVLPVFAWCAFCTPRAAVVVWTVVLIALAALGTWMSCRSRDERELRRVPLLLAVAAFFFSSPFLYALERGNYDLVILPLLVAAAWGLTRGSLYGDLSAGTSLALAVALKVYPALLVMALVPLRRFRALLCSLVVLGGLLLPQYREVLSFRVNIQELASRHIPVPETPVNPAAHSLSGDWLLFWTGTPLEQLCRIPGTAASLGLLIPPLLWVGHRVYKSPRFGDLVYPYLLWTLAAATFVPYIANDYSLVFLPLAAIAVWDQRNSVKVQMGMTLMVLCLQPASLTIGAKLLMVFKCAALAAVGLSLLEETRQRGPTEIVEETCAREVLRSVA